jgi:hypothetical protein
MYSAVEGSKMIRKVPKEKRQKRRGPISVPVSFTAGAGEREGVEVREGMTADFSESGLGLYSPQAMNPGAVLEIECQDIWETPKKFTVCWCNRVSNNFYRIGLSLQQ